MMQPTFLPWQGYFELICQSERFVFADDYQFSFGSYHQRNRLFLAIGRVGWFTVPMQKASYNRPLNQARIAETSLWRSRMWRQIRQNYSPTPFFSQIGPAVEKWLSTPADSLAAQDISFIHWACNIMGIEREFRMSSERPSSLSRSHRAVDLLHWCEADQFFSARGSFGYMQSDGVLPVDGVEILFQDFQPKPYQQHGAMGGFIPYLSVIDALFNVGPEKTLDLIRTGTQKWWTWDEMVASGNQHTIREDEPCHETT
jgi:hypothetical protein